MRCTACASGTRITRTPSAGGASSWRGGPARRSSNLPPRPWADGGHRDRNPARANRPCGRHRGARHGGVDDRRIWNRACPLVPFWPLPVARAHDGPSAKLDSRSLSGLFSESLTTRTLESDFGNDKLRVASIWGGLRGALRRAMMRRVAPSWRSRMRAALLASSHPPRTGSSAVMMASRRAFFVMRANAAVRRDEMIGERLEVLHVRAARSPVCGRGWPRWDSVRRWRGNFCR